MSWLGGERAHWWQAKCSSMAAGPRLHCHLHARALPSPARPAGRAHLACPCRPRCCTDKDRQRGIIIGKAGSALKALGAAARAEIEEFLGRPVYLSISVKASA